MPRWLKFNAVGMLGALVQLGVLALLVKLGVHYLLATALAVEAAVLQNYYWHARWTWKGRDGSLWRFHLANGLLSVISNLIWMRIFTGWLGVPPIPANLMAIALTSVANFLFGDRWVFQKSLSVVCGARQSSQADQNQPDRNSKAPELRVLHRR